MFNKYKKYGIIKGLPFVCFTNINAGDDFISGEDNIKVVVNGETYVLAEDTVINKDKNANININDDILAWKGVWDNGDDDESDLPKNLDDNEKYKLVSFTIDNAETKENASNILKGKKYSEIKSYLTLNFESIYKIADDSKLSDGKNEIDISGTPILYSDLKELSTVKKLEEFIKSKFQEEVFGGIVEGCLKGIKIKNIAFDKFFIKECVDSGELDDSVVSTKVTKKIKDGKPLKITFKPYVNYTINEIKLSKALAKRRKLKDNLADVKKIFNDKYGKLVVKISLSDIQDFIKGHGNNSFNQIKIANAKDDNDITPDKLTSIEVIADTGNAVSELMKGKIKFTYDHNKLKQLNKGDKDNKFVNEINFKFSIPQKDFDDKLSIAKETPKTSIIASIKKYLGGIDDGKYEVIYDKGFDDTKVTDEFEITVNIKDEIPNFTAKLDETEINVQVNFKIDNDDSNYELSGISNKDFTLKNVNVYDDFVAALKKELKDIDNEIKEVKFETTNKVWSSDAEKSNVLQTFLVNSTDKIITVTVTLKKNDNGTYVKKKAEPKPKPEEKTTQFTLAVSTNVTGKKVKEEKKQLIVTLENNKLNTTELYAKVKDALSGDGKFIIKKGNSAVKDDNTKLDTNTNAYSVELTSGSNFIEDDKKDEKKYDPNKQNGDDKGKQNGGNKEKKGCCGKCYGPKDKK